MTPEERAYEILSDIEDITGRLDLKTQNHILFWAKERFKKAQVETFEEAGEIADQFRIEAESRVVKGRNVSANAIGIPMDIAHEIRARAAEMRGGK